MAPGADSPFVQPGTGVRFEWGLSGALALAGPGAPERLVLASPNGSTIAAGVRAGTVVAACLRTATAVATWLAEHGFGTAERPVAVIAAGEQLSDGQLRPAFEDLLGDAQRSVPVMRAGAFSPARGSWPPA